MVAPPAYGPAPAEASLPAFDLTSGRFSTNPALNPGSGADAAGEWEGEIISGRYAQKGDPKTTFWEGFTSVPYSLSSAPDYARRTLLPHHDEIAVDSAKPGKRHQLYANPAKAAPADRAAYPNQYRWRLNTAAAHIRQAFLDHWHG